MYPRHSKGIYCDNGKLVNLGFDGKPAKCPNCGGSGWRETVSRESCSDCGISFDYWGGNANEAYKQYEQRKEAEARQKEWDEDYEFRNSREWYLGSD